MPSAYDEIFALGREVLLQQHGRAVTWTKADGTVIAVSNAIVGADVQTVVDTDMGQVLERSRTLEIPTATVAGPNRGDTVTIDGVTWGYEQTLSISGGLAHVKVVRPEQAEITGREYRT